MVSLPADGRIFRTTGGTIDIYQGAFLSTGVAWGTTNAHLVSAVFNGSSSSIAVDAATPVTGTAGTITFNSGTPRRSVALRSGGDCSGRARSRGRHLPGSTQRRRLAAIRHTQRQRFGGPKTWTRSAATVAATATSGAWEITGGPKTWTRSPATVTVAAVSGLWSVPSIGPWIDTDFTGINASGEHYQPVVTQYAGDGWGVGTPGQLTTGPFGGTVLSRRLDAADSDNQFVRVSVANFNNPFYLVTHVSTPYGGRITDAANNGYELQWLGNGSCYIWRGGTWEGNPSFATQTGSGTVEWRVINRVGYLLVNGVEVLTRSFTANPQLTGRYQSFGINTGGQVIYDASGGDVVTGKTWTRTPATITASGTSDTWRRSGAAVVERFGRHAHCHHASQLVVAQVGDCPGARCRRSQRRQGG